MDFFGSGWDVAQRMGLTPALQAVRYPIDALEFVDAHGRPFMCMPIERMRRALGGKYVYLRRQDLERILAEKARAAGIAPRYGCSLAALDDKGMPCRRASRTAARRNSRWSSAPSAFAGARAHLRRGGAVCPFSRPACCGFSRGGRKPADCAHRPPL
jgi:2-polyprenyl-6-methoxyphenol hydroxylase-like FAD-dependent oxidoreductase